MKGGPNERGQTDDKPNLIKKPVAEALFACRHAAREKGRGGRGGRKEKERKEKVLPATTQASRDTPKRKGPQL